MLDCPGSNPCATTRERSISRSSTCTPAEVVALDPPPGGEYASIAFRFQFHWRLLALESEATPGVELVRSEEHTSELQSQSNLVCRLLLEKKKRDRSRRYAHHSRLLGGTLCVY